jgi:hypothetical protein
LIFAGRKLGYAPDKHVINLEETEIANVEVSYLPT